MPKRKLTSAERKRLRTAFAGMRADLREMCSLLDVTAERLRQAEAREVRRRARLRRLTFDLLGR